MMLVLGTVAACTFYLASQWAQGMSLWQTLLRLPALMSLEIGIKRDQRQGRPGGGVRPQEPVSSHPEIQRGPPQRGRFPFAPPSEDPAPAPTVAAAWPQDWVSAAGGQDRSLR